MTYPIEGFPWRRNPIKTYEFEIDPEIAAVLFEEVRQMQRDYPDHCLSDEVLWCDHSEKANGITRDDKTDTLCHTIAIYDTDWQATDHYYSMKEDSDVLQSSQLFETVMSLIKPYERL